MKALSLILALTAITCTLATSPLIAVSEVDLSQYAGTWYEIARIPFYWEEDCYCTVATYTLNSNGTVGVNNVCNVGSATGMAVTAQGIASPDDAVNGTITTGRLTVEFGPQEAPYYIIDLDPNYQYALVGDPTRSYLWVLSRTPTINSGLYNELLSIATSDGYDVSQVVQGYQGSGCNYDRQPSMVV